MNAHPAVHVLTRRARNTVIAVSVTAVSASTAWFLAAVMRLAESTVVMSVMVLAFVASWLVTNAQRPDDILGRRTGQHRVTLVPARTRIR
jgi:ABC-type Zn2+ transport system substrate-binding protein/surface adhesin